MDYVLIIILFSWGLGMPTETTVVPFASMELCQLAKANIGAIKVRSMDMKIVVDCYKTK